MSMLFSWRNRGLSAHDYQKKWRLGSLSSNGYSSPDYFLIAYLATCYLLGKFCCICPALVLYYLIVAALFLSLIGKNERLALLSIYPFDFIIPITLTQFLSFVWN